MNLFRCRRCLYPNTKPDLWFSDDGVCSACLAFDARSQVDWDAKRDEFLSIVKASPGKTHDVIVACSGGKDSTAQVVKCLELGLRPLAVAARTDNTSQWGRYNLDNIGNLCDVVEVVPHKLTRKKIAKFALQEVGDISWCEHHLIWSIPAREAVARDIPIVLYGECPQNEYGAGPKGSESQTQLTKAWVHEFGGLLGLRLADVAEIPDIDERHLEVYRYPVEAATKVKALFMGSYFPWDGYANFKIAEANGFRPFHGEVEASLFNYENIDNLQTGIHDRLRWLKFGYSRAVDISSNHIRRGMMTRKEAVELVKCRETVKRTSYLAVPMEYILADAGISVTEFDDVCERFTNRPVIEWASSAESFQSFYGTSTDASKESSSTQAAA